MFLGFLLIPKVPVGYKYPSIATTLATLPVASRDFLLRVNVASSELVVTMDRT